MAFVHYTVKKIVHGLGAIKEAANEVKNLKGSKAFIVTDPGLAKIGVQKPLEEALTAGGVEWKLYAEAQLEPSMDSIQHCTDEAKAFGADVIIGFGGGSALDTTKAASVLLSNEGPIDKYFGEIEAPVMLVHGNAAHSFYFSEDTYEQLKAGIAPDNKELVVVPGASHTDLYDQVDIIPFDKITAFYEKALA